MISGSPPDRSAILKHATACGFAETSLVFSVDSDGIDNVDIYPLGEPDEAYIKSVECFIDWAQATGAAVGLHFNPKPA